MIARRHESEEQFLTRLMTSPKEAIAAVGLCLTDEESALFRRLRPEDVRAFLAEFRVGGSGPASRRA